MMELDHKKIVVTFLMHLGDVMLTTPFLHVLRQAAPHSEITYVVDEKLQDLISENPNLDHVVTVDKKGKDNSIGALRRIAKEIRQTYAPDIVINLHPNERTSFLTWSIGAPTVVGMSHFLFRPFMTQYTRLDRIHLHAADMYIDVLAQLGVSDLSNKGLELYTKPEWDQEADSFYQKHHVKDADGVIGFNVGSAVPQKRWPKERFAAVADHFNEHGYKTVFFGGSMDLEMVKAVRDAMKSAPIIATGQFGLGPLAAAIRRCNIFITNDSGPMHIAVSQHVPVLALYGPSNPALYGPYTKNCSILESMHTYEVGKSMKKIIREGHYKGLSVIPTEDVIQAANALLTPEDEL